MNKQPQVTAQTKQNIIDAFWDLYSKQRIEKITVKEITVKAGYNRGTFYEYFTDVYDVLEQIENSLIPNLSELPPLELPEGNFGMPLDIFLKLYEQNSKYYSVLLGDNGDSTFVGKLKKAIKPTLAQAFSHQKGDNIEFDFILEYTLSAMIGIMNYWFANKDNLSTDSLIKLMYDLMENGVIGKLQVQNEHFCPAKVTSC